MKLHIDTRDRAEITVSICHGKETWVLAGKTDAYSSQIVLPLILQILTDHGLTLSHIREITVAPGPGSFTGLRVGASVGQMLSLLLDVPINSQPPGSTVELVYTS